MNDEIKKQLDELVVASSKVGVECHAYCNQFFKLMPDAFEDIEKLHKELESMGKAKLFDALMIFAGACEDLMKEHLKVLDVAIEDNKPE